MFYSEPRKDKKTSDIIITDETLYRSIYGVEPNCKLVDF